MNIGVSIKNLRRQKSITQERLAEYLDVSVSAVSQWECGKTAPDIAMLPMLAVIFDISIDELLGVNIQRKQNEIDKINKEYNRLSNLGCDAEKFDYICDAYKKYPTEPSILDKYLWNLCYDPNHNSDGLLFHEEQISVLCERILNESSEDFLRYTALNLLGSIAAEKGDNKKALEYAKRLPQYYSCAEEVTENFYERGSEAWWDNIRSNIYKLADMLLSKIEKSALYSEIAPEVKIGILKKAISLLELVYDEEDFGFSYYHLSELNIWIANRFVELGDTNNAEKYLDSGLNFAKKYDELPRVTVHSSFLVRNHKFYTDHVYSGHKKSEVKRALECICDWELYDDVRSSEWFGNIIEKYKPYASDIKPNR